MRKRIQYRVTHNHTDKMINKKQNTNTLIHLKWMERNLGQPCCPAGSGDRK